MITAYLALSGRILLLGVERILVKKLGANSDSAAAAYLFLNLAVMFIFPFVFFYEVESYDFLVYPLINAAIYSVAFYLYVKSLSTGEASLVSPLSNFSIFFLLVISNIFLEESFTIYKLVGMVLLFYGAGFLNKQRNFIESFKAILNDRSCRMMIACSFLVAIGRVVDGFTVRSNVPPVIYVFSLSIITLIYSTLYIVLSGRTRIVINLFKEKPVTALSSGAVNAFSYLLLVVAFTRIDVSIAEPASMLSLIITVGLSSIIFKEKIKNRVVGVLVMIAGAWLLFL